MFLRFYPENEQQQQQRQQQQRQQPEDRSQENANKFEMIQTPSSKREIQAQTFVEKVTALNLPQLSMAHLQAHFMFYKNDPEGAIFNCQKLAQI